MTFDLYLVTSLSCKPYHYLSKLHYFFQIFLFYFFITCIGINFHRFWSKDHVYLAYCSSQTESEWEIIYDPSQSKNPWRPLSNHSKASIVKNYQPRKSQGVNQHFTISSKLHTAWLLSKSTFMSWHHSNLLEILVKKNITKKWFLNYKILHIV